MKKDPILFLKQGAGWDPGTFKERTLTTKLLCRARASLLSLFTGRILTESFAISNEMTYSPRLSSYS